MVFVISRFPEGVTLNPKEYVLDERGNLMKFPTHDKAKEFLIKNGVPEDQIDNGINIDEEPDNI